MTDDGGSDGGRDEPPTAGEGEPSPADDRIPDDVERAELVRAVADDVRGESSQSEQLAAVLYRVSDLYDPDEETSPEDIYRSVKNIFEIKERGTLERDT